MNRKGAIELSLGTIVIIVLAVTMLILGIVFVRNLMCSGIVMTDVVNRGVMKQLTILFGSDTYGVTCTGEPGDEYKVGTGGPRAVFCLIKTDKQTEYDIKVKSLESLGKNGASTSTVQGWVIDTGWKGSISAGGEGKTQSVLRLNIPRDAPSTQLKINLDIKDTDTDSVDSKTLYVEVVPAGLLRTTMC
jgi:hypothetical protein